MLRKPKVYIPTILIVSLFIYFSYLYVGMIDKHIKSMNLTEQREQARNIKNDIKHMIFQKKKATLAVALALSINPRLPDMIVNKNINSLKYKELLTKLKINTL